MMMPENVFDFSTALKSCHAESTAARPFTCQVTWQVPADLPYLNGHFPQMPIVPAVAMIDASIALIKEFQHNPRLRLKTVKQAKFMSPLTVGDEVTIQARAGRVDENKSEAWDIDWKNAEGLLLVRLSLLMV